MHTMCILRKSFLFLVEFSIQMILHALFSSVGFTIINNTYTKIMQIGGNLISTKIKSIKCKIFFVREPYYLSVFCSFLCCFRFIRFCCDRNEQEQDISSSECNTLYAFTHTHFTYTIYGLTKLN